MSVPSTLPLDAVPPTRLLLRIEEAADRLGIGRSTMYHLVMTGEVESIVVGRLRRIPVDALTHYIERLRHDRAQLMEHLDAIS